MWRRQRVVGLKRAVAIRCTIALAGLLYHSQHTHSLSYTHTRAHMFSIAPSVVCPDHQMAPSSSSHDYTPREAHVCDGRCVFFRRRPRGRLHNRTDNMLLLVCVCACTAVTTAACAHQRQLHVDSTCCVVPLPRCLSFFRCCLRSAPGGGRRRTYARLFK